MATRRYIVGGRVQGVGFRWYVEREARALGVSGWVRNNEDSTVELLANGSEEQLTQLKRKLVQGPRASRVDRVEEIEAAGDAAESLTTFEIRGAW